MAKRKKKSRTSGETKAIKETAAQIGQSPESQRGENVRHGVGMGACLAGMFLTLVLGVYLGTLLPDMMAKSENSRATGAVNDTQGQGMQASVPLDHDLGQLVADLEKKAAANPNSAPDWINLGNIYFDSQQPLKAISAYEHALHLAPKNADVLTDLGIMYRETGQFEHAVDCFRKAVAINPEHENALYNEGVVMLNDLKKKAEAVAVWQKLLELNPHAISPQGKPMKELLDELQ